MSIKHLEHTAVQKALGERGGVVALGCASTVPDRGKGADPVRAACKCLDKEGASSAPHVNSGYHGTHGSIAGRGIHHMNYRGKQHLHIQKSQPR